jgi:HD superfamily phosphohydrolase YqeK
MFNLIVKMGSQNKELLKQTKVEMENYFGTDQRRIDHALQVSLYAQELLAYIDADPVVTLAAAYLHDIGIHEAERKHCSSSGKWQEIEGPPIARTILEKLGAEEEGVEHVVNIVANHHTPAGVNSPEFRVIWDADALVNFAESLPGKEADEVEKTLLNHMVTEAGYRIARKIFLQNTEGHKRCLEGHRPAALP